MYPIYSSGENIENKTGLYFIIHDQIEIWTPTGGSFTSHNGGELHLYRDELPIAVARTIGTEQVDITTTLMLYAQELTPWVPTINQLHPVYTTNQQIHAISKIMSERPDTTRHLDVHRSWVWAIFDHAIEPEIRQAQRIAESCPVSDIEPIIHWLANKTDNLPADIWVDAQYVARKIVYQMVNTIQNRLSLQRDSYPTYENILLPNTPNYPDLNPNWRIIYRWGRICGEHHAWAPVMADLVGRRWQTTQDPSTRDHVIDWTHRHQLTEEQIQLSTGLPMETITNITRRPPNTTQSTYQPTYHG